MEIFESYFENIAKKHTALQHDPEGLQSFFIIEDWDNPTEVLKAVGRQVGETIMILEDFEDHLTDNDADNNTAIISSAFSILQFVSDKRGDKKTAKENCRRIGKSIAHKMKFDGMNGVLAEQRITCKLDSKGFPVGPVMSGYYGWRYSFSWVQPERIALVPADWLP